MARKTVAMFAAGCAGLVLASSSFAGGAADAPSVRVSYSDLDLTKDAGVDRLYARLRRASGSVCGTSDIRDLHNTSRQRACVARALDGAVEAVHSAKLSARHQGAGDTARLAAEIE
jgi:UrcA family protein